MEKFTVRAIKTANGEKAIIAKIQLNEKEHAMKMAEQVHKGFMDEKFMERLKEEGASLIIFLLGFLRLLLLLLVSFLSCFSPPIT